MRFDQWPENPWKEYSLEPDKARLEIAIHRAARRVGWDTSLDRCGWCGERHRFAQVGEAWPSRWRTGRMRYDARCEGCGETSLRSYHPSPVQTPGLAAF